MPPGPSDHSRNPVGPRGPASREEIPMPGALRYGDMHVCDKTTGTCPHVGGPVGPKPLNTSVFINGRPAAVVGDMVVCVGVPDRIVAGHASVTIGGRRAADASARSQHGGTFITYSGNVSIG